MLRLRQALILIEARLGAALSGLADLAEDHAETPQAARTYGQLATPSSFGAQVASWGRAPSASALTGWKRYARARFACRCRGAAGDGLHAGAGPGRPAFGAGGGPGSLRPRRQLAREPRPDRRTRRLACRPDHGLRQDGRGPDAPDPLGHRGRSACPARAHPPPCRRSRTRWRRRCWWRSPISLPRRRPVLQGAAVHAEARDGAAWFAEWLSLPPLVAASARAGWPFWAIWRGDWRCARPPWRSGSTTRWA